MNGLRTMLEQAPTLSQLPQEDLAELARIAQQKSLEKTEYICRQGEIWPNALYIISGTLAWTLLSPNGKRQVVLELHPGDIVIGHSLIDEGPMPASLETISKCEICTWNQRDILPILIRNTTTLWQILSSLSLSVRQACDVIYGFAFCPVSARVAQMLLTHYHPDEGQATPRDLTLDDMASMAGTTREFVSKILYDFAAQGIIEITRNQITFVDPNKLKKLTGR